MHARRFRLTLCFLAVVAALMACGISTVVGQPGGSWTNYGHIGSKTADRSWLVLMCKFKDVPDEPAGLMDKARNFFTTAGQGSGNLLDYYSDVSYGQISLARSRVIGWYTAPFNQSDLQGNDKRGEQVRECAQVVPPSDADFHQYYGVVMVSNVDNQYGACYDGRASMNINGHSYPLACVILQPSSLNITQAAHEIGHGVGWSHAFANTQNYCSTNAAPGEYCDRWDIMGDGLTAFSSGTFPADGPGIGAPDLLEEKWIPALRMVTYHIGDPSLSVPLTALSRPNTIAPLALEIAGSDPHEVYTVEYRQKEGWDQGIPDSTVLIHEYYPGQSPYSMLLLNHAPVAGEWLPGMLWTDPAHNVSVSVTTIDPQKGLASITVEPAGLISTTAPIIRILAPADGSHVIEGEQVQLAASATTWDGHPLPDSSVIWSANGMQFATGMITKTSFVALIPFTITATASDNGQSADATITIFVDPPAPPPSVPTAQILSPINGEEYRTFAGTGFQIVLSSSASAGVTQYAWSDSMHLFTDTHANDVVTVPGGCLSGTDTISLVVTDGSGQTASAPHVTITLISECTG